MSCAAVESDLIELARGMTLADDRSAAVERHVRGCARCVERLERERAMSAGLRRLAEDTIAPPWAPESEQKLLAAFDAARTRGAAAEPVRRTARLLQRAGTVAIPLALTATMAWMVVKKPVDARNNVHNDARTNGRGDVVEPPAAAAPAMPVVRAQSRATRPRRPWAPPVPAGTAFVIWPGAGDLPTFESGQLMRVALPASVAVSLGLRPSRLDALVETDVLVGQDGYARAVRLSENAR